MAAGDAGLARQLEVAGAPLLPPAAGLAALNNVLAGVQHAVHASTSQVINHNGVLSCKALCPGR